MLAKRLLQASEAWSDVMKVLVVASEPVVRARRRGGTTDDADIMVVAPGRFTARSCALDSRTLMMRSDERSWRSAKPVEGLDDAGLDARGDTGRAMRSSNVLVAFRA
jgi:hypothetical protein